MTNTRSRSQADLGTIIVAGVDTHADTHDVTVLDLHGKILAADEFPATTAGYQTLLDWVASFGVIHRIGIELTGAYGAGLTRYLQAHDIEVLDVDTTHRQVRARRGKDDRIDSEQAARKVLSGEATTVPKDRTGVVEAIRVFTVQRNSALKSRTIAEQNLRDLLVTAPAGLRESFPAGTLRQKARHAARLRPVTARKHEPEQAMKMVLKQLGARVAALTEEIDAALETLDELVRQVAPELVTEYGIKTITAAQLLITHGQPRRIHSEAAFARLCGVAPIPVSSGKSSRLRLHRGGDRQANRALYLIALTRMAHHEPTQAYIAKREAEGKDRRDIIRALKRAIARRVYRILEQT